MEAAPPPRLNGEGRVPLAQRMLAKSRAPPGEGEGGGGWRRLSVTRPDTSCAAPRATWHTGRRRRRRVTLTPLPFSALGPSLRAWVTCLSAGRDPCL